MFTEFKKEKLEQGFDEFNIEEAIWYFCNDYHHGQGDLLYEELCKSKFNPGPYSTLKSMESKELYDMLEKEFK